MRARRRACCWLFSLLSLVLAPGCERSVDSVAVPAEEPPAVRAEDPRPNIVLVTLCSFRKNRLGLEGYHRPLTPFLDALAAEGTYFANAVASSSWTKPTTASLLTGVTPGVHQMTDYYALGASDPASTVRVLPDAFETLPELLAGAGYRTMCRINNPHAGREFGMVQGCDDRGPTESLSTMAMIDDFAGWLERGGTEKPFFFFLMTLHVHAPYKPPYESYRRFTRWDGPPVTPEKFDAHREEIFETVWETARTRGEPVSLSLQNEWIDLYDAAVADLDATLADLVQVLETAGVREQTMIVVTADHGEAFWENGMIEHGLQLSEALVAVPLIVSGPHAEGARRVEDVVRTIDVYPTLAEWAGVPPPGLVQGESLATYLAPAAPSAPERPAYSSLGSRRSLRIGSHKLLEGPDGSALYDVARDPKEEHDLRAAETEITARLEAELQRWRKDEAKRAAAAPEARTTELPKDTKDRLKALGYIADP